MALVLDSVSSPIKRRVYNLELDEFIAWFPVAPRPAGFAKATATPWIAWINGVRSQGVRVGNGLSLRRTRA